MVSVDSARRHTDSILSKLNEELRSGSWATSAQRRLEDDLYAYLSATEWDESPSALLLTPAQIDELAKGVTSRADSFTRKMSDGIDSPVMASYSEGAGATEGQSVFRVGSGLPRPTLDVAKDVDWNKRHIVSLLAAEAAKGSSAEEASRNVAARVVDMERNSLMRMARTFVNGAENLGRLNSMLAKGGYKRWVAVMDNRTRHSHAMLNGKVVKVNEKFPNGLMFPGDPFGKPEEVYNCRCTIEWVERSSEQQ